MKPDDPIEARKRLHDRFAVMARTRSAWVTSIPGSATVTFDALPSSPFPDDMRDLGYDVTPEGEGERILPVAIVERFARGPGGGLELVTEESTRAVVEARHHAGIARVKRWSFEI